MAQWTTGDNTRNWFDSFQGRDYWRTLVNGAMNLKPFLKLNLRINPEFLRTEYIDEKLGENDTKETSCTELHAEN